MLRLLHLFAAVLIPLALLSTPAAAQKLSKQEIDLRFKMFDSNADGRISKDEFELNKVVALFSPLPRSRTASGEQQSGALDRQIAIARQMSRLTPEAFNALDTNSDGVLTGAEIIASQQMRFENIDRNGDGYIDRAEFQALVDSLFR
jgi:Ca2+-binding EF-hand superfamily protein